MGKNDDPSTGRTDIDRLAEAARRILNGEPTEVVAEDMGCPLADLRALGDQLVKAGLAQPRSNPALLEWAPWFFRKLRWVLGGPRAGAGEAMAAETEPWSEWQPVPSARVLEVRTRIALGARTGGPAPLWAYEFRSQGPFTVNFRYRIDTETSGGFPRRVRGLRPGECYGGMTVVPSPEPPGIDAELIEPDPDWPASPAAAGP